jgi:hypothetical protein
MSMPASTSASTAEGSVVAGPRVQTIRAFRTAREATTPLSTPSRDSDRALQAAARGGTFPGEEDAVMPHSSDSKGHLKEKAIAETQKLVLYSVYLMLVFVAFANYRRLVLAGYGISYFHYGYAIVEALVVAKIVLIGEALNLGEKYSDRPLIVPTLIKSVLFGMLAAAFAILEHLVAGAIHGEGLSEIWADIISKGTYEILARGLVMVVAFIPFFALWELDRALGDVRFYDLFFKPRPAPAERSTAP